MVILIVFSLFSFGASAEEISDYNLDFKLPNEFIVITKDNAKEHSEFLETMNFTASSFQNYIINNNIILFATTSNKTTQISVNAVKTDFSEQTEDLNYLEDEYIARLLPEMIDDNISSNEIKVFKDSKFIKVTNKSFDKAGEYCYLQYITVKNGYLFNITFSFSVNSLTQSDIDYADALMKNLTIDKAREKITITGIENIATHIVLVLVILFLISAVVYIIYTFIMDIIKNRNTSDVAPYVKIKRRRFK